MDFSADPGGQSVNEDTEEPAVDGPTQVEQPGSGSFSSGVAVHRFHYSGASLYIAGWDGR